MKNKRLTSQNNRHKHNRLHKYTSPPPQPSNISDSGTSRPRCTSSCYSKAYPLFFLSCFCRQILTADTGLSRPQRHQQYHHVGPFHPSSHSRSLHDKSLHHQHRGQFPRHSFAGYACLPGSGWRDVVDWSWYDGSWVYSCWDERGGMIVYTYQLVEISF